MKRDLNWKWN